MKKEPREAILEVPDKIEMNYRYSYGGLSRFFSEIKKNRRLFGARCARCRKVYMPPRASCSVCDEPTQWVPLAGSGSIVAATTVYYATSRFFDQTPFVCAYIKLDGADTALLQNVRSDVPLPAGSRVKAVFRPRREGRISDFYFVPVKSRKR